MKRSHSRYNPFKIEVEQRIQQFAFYFISTAFILIISLEIYKLLLIDNYNLTIYLAANLILVIVAMILFIKTGNLFVPQRLLFVILLSFMFTIINLSGGEYSIIVLYFLVAFPIFIVFFDRTLLIIISSFYFIGMLVMFQLDEFAPNSIFRDPVVRLRFYPVLILSYLVGIVTSIGYNRLINTLSHLAFTDGVCNLPNRERFILLLNNYIKRNKGERFSVVGIRIRSFHELETQVDFNVINELLIEISKRVNKFDFEIKSRWNNDTFLCLLQLNSTGHSKEIIHSLQRNLEDVYELHDNKWTLTFQIGVSTYPDNTVEPDMLITSVLANLNKNPMEHGNIVYNEDTVIDEYKYRETLLNVLHDDDLNKEFSILYIPIIELESNLAIGAEAIIHWDSFESGKYSTKQLIQFAEDRGVIRNITRWVIDKVFWDISTGDIDLYCFIHISILDLKDVTFIPHIITLTQKYKIDPVKINFVVSERILVDHDEVLNHSLIRLHNMNFSLTLDDFGSGYSSLENFRNIPINQIMISKKFIDLINHSGDGKGQKIIESIVSIANVFNFQVVAKGVESYGQKEFLLKKECHFAQGDLFSKELNVKALELYLDRNRS